MFMLSGDVKLQLMGAQSAGVLYRQCYIGGGAGGTGGTAPPPNDGVGGTMHSGPPNSDTSGLWTKHTVFGKTLLRVTKFERTFLERVSVAGSFGHPMTKMLSASGGLRPPP